MSGAEERILEAARRVFARRGFEAASLEEIAREAGVSKSLVLWYFKSKRSLVRRVALSSLPGSIASECLGLSGADVLECVIDRFLEKYSDPVERRLLLHALAYQALDEEVDREASRLCSIGTVRALAERAYGRSGEEERVRVRSLLGALLCYVVTPHECMEPRRYGEVLKRLYVEPLRDSRH